jgi:paraquat-inducible protein B
LERGPFVSRDDPSGGNMDQLRKNLEDAIAQGLRAQLALQSLLTGQLYVNLVLRPETPASFAKLEPGMLEIPTIPTIMAQLEAGLQQVPLAKVPKHLYDTLEGSAKLLQSQDLAKALESVGPLVADAQTLLRRVDKEAVPLLVSLRATSDTARSSLVDITQRLDRVVTDLQTDASRLMTSLTDTSDTARGTVKDVGGTVKDVGSDLQKTLAQLAPEVAKLAAKLQEASDALRATLEKTDTTLRSVDGTLAGDSPVGHELTQALKEVAAAAQSLQTLAEYLERHPESLLTGKPRARPVR